MKIRLLVFISLLSLCPAAAYASTLTFKAVLGDFENPHTGTAGQGSAKVIIDNVANSMSVDIVFSGLLAPTTVGHIHCCVLPSAAGVIAIPFSGLPVGVTSGTYSQVFNLTLASSWNNAFIIAHGGTPQSAEADLLAGMLNGQAYLNIHTSLNPGGEIRGVLEAVPEPASVSLLGLGLAIGGWKAWHARRRAA